MPSADTEDALVEQPAIEVFEDLGWTARRCYDELFGSDGSLGRETSSEVILTRHLRQALERLNPGLAKYIGRLGQRRRLSGAPKGTRTDRSDRPLSSFSFLAFSHTSRAPR